MPAPIRPGLGRAAATAASAVFVLAVAFIAILQPRPAAAAQLTEVTDFGPNPSDLQMYLYVPDDVPADAPILVGVHWCSGSGPDFYNGTSYDTLADEHGFIVVYPSVTRSSKCFDVASPQALTRGGGSDPVAIKSMIDHVQSNYDTDPDRVFVTGVSSGAMMTNVLLGNYPDVFAAGSAFAGVPHSCFATDNGSEWNSECANGQVIRSAQEWGDLARGAYPGYDGPRPRVQLWHGTEDDALRYPNFGEMIKQWTNVHGLDQDPDFTDQPQSNWTRTRYGDTGPQAPVEAISMQGVGHNLPVQEERAVEFFGLDSDGPTDPPTAPTDPPTDPTTPPDGECAATVDVINDWGSGWQGNVSVTAGSAALSGWTLTWTWPGGQSISSYWNADVAVSGPAVTANDVDWNGSVAAGQTMQAWGFIATGPAVSPEVTCSAA